MPLDKNRTGEHPPGRLRLLVRRLVRVVVLDVVMQQAGLPEGLGAAISGALEGVVVQLDGEDGRWLVLNHPVD